MGGIHATQKGDSLFYQIKCKPLQRLSFGVFAHSAGTLPSSCLSHLLGPHHTKERSALNRMQIACFQDETASATPN